MIGATSWVVGAIVRMQHAMRKLAGGNLDTPVPCLDRKDEIGLMAGAVQVFHDNALERNKLNREAKLLSELNEWLQSCKSLEELYQMVGEFVSRLLPGCAGTLYIYANSRDVLEARARVERRCLDVGHPARRLLGIAARAHVHLRRGGNPLPLRPRQLGRYGQLLLHPDPRPRRDHRHAAPGVRAAQGGESARRGSVEGIAEQRRLGLVCAEQISLAIANVKLRDQLRDQSIRDALTGMFNRRYMLETCRREFSRAARAGHSRRHPVDRRRSLQEVQRQSRPRRRRHGAARGRRPAEEQFPRRGRGLPVRR